MLDHRVGSCLPIVDPPFRTAEFGYNRSLTAGIRPALRRVSSLRCVPAASTNVHRSVKPAVLPSDDHVRDVRHVNVG